MFQSFTQLYPSLHPAVDCVTRSCEFSDQVPPLHFSDHCLDGDPIGGMRAQLGSLHLVLPGTAIVTIRSPVAPTLPTSITQRHCCPWRTQ